LDKPKDADEEDEDAQKVEENLDFVTQIVESIEDEVIPEATARYLGFYEDMDDYGDEFGDDDDDDDMGSDEDAGPKPKKGKKGKGGGPPMPSEKDCKQQ
jgi:hypothetical protein